MFFVGVSLAFFVLHTSLFLFHRRERGNLYLAVAALGFSGLTIFSILAGTGRTETHWETAIVASVGVMILGFIRFGHYFTRQRAPRIFGFFVGGAVAAVVWHAVSGNLLLPHIISLLSLVELARCLVIGSRQTATGHSWLVGLGFLAIFLTAANDNLSDLGILPTPGGTYAFGMLFLFLALSLYLSWEFADTHHQLELKLAEVQELSQQALEQERLAKRREVERRLLAQEHERQKQQLEAARRLQISLLPAYPPRTPGVEVEFEMRTASEVGGDYYDYRQGDGGALLVAIGDATGHGIDAGLLVAATKGLFHAIPVDADVIESLERIASGLAGLGLRRMFMALTLVRYEHGRVDLVTAGMPPLLLRRQGTHELEELSVHAPPLGAITNARYQPLTTTLSPGDTLLAMTDGLPERRNAADELLGYSRLADGYREASHQSLDAVRAALFGAADDWAAGEARHDDETVVLLRRTA